MAFSGAVSSGVEGVELLARREARLAARGVEVDPEAFLHSCAVKHALQHGMREALTVQAEHRAAHASSAGGAVAEGSACEWKPGAGKAKKKQQEAHDAVQSGSACEWTPGKKH